MYIVIHEEGNCGCENDPFDYRILGIFNTKDEAEVCVNEKEKENKILKEKRREYYAKSYEERKNNYERYCHFYETYIEDIESPITPVKGMTLYLTIDSYERGENFESIEGVFLSEDEAKLFVAEREKEFRIKHDISEEKVLEVLYIFPFTIT